MEVNTLKEALKKADRIDKAITINLKNGESITVYMPFRFCWSYTLHRREREYIVKFLKTPKGRYYREMSLARFLEESEYIGIESIYEPLPHLITIEEMADVFADTFDINEYSPQLDDEDEYGRALGNGSGSYEIETEEDDFYIRGEIDVSAHGYYDSGDYFNPPESEYEIDRIVVYITEAGWIDEEGEETPLSKEQIEMLQSKLQKQIA